MSIRNLAKKNGSNVQFAIGTSAINTSHQKRSASGESDSPLARKKQRSDQTKGNDKTEDFINDLEDYDTEQDGNKNANDSSTPKARRPAVSKFAHGLPTPSRSAQKPHKRRSPSFYDEAKFTSDSDSFEDLNAILYTPSKARQLDKMKLRPVRPRSYVLDEEEGATDSDISEFDPLEERKKEDKKARGRQGLWNADEVSD